MSEAAASLFSLSHVAGTRLAPEGEGSEIAALPHVGQRPEPLTDESREAAIVLAGKLMERRYAVWASEGCFAALGDAHRAMKLMRVLIAGRSPEQVHKLEQERGLA